MSCAPPDLPGPDNLSAAWALLPFPLVNFQAILEFTRPAFPVHILPVGRGGAPVLDGFPQDSPDRPVETLDLVFGQGIRFSQRVDPGPEEGLVAVYIPQAGDDLLIQESRLTVCKRN